MKQDQSTKNEPDDIFSGIGIKPLRDWLRGMSKRNRRILGIVSMVVVYSIGGLILAITPEGVAEGRLLGAMLVGVLLLIAALVAFAVSGFKYYFKNRHSKDITLGKSFKRSFGRIFNGK